MPERKFAMPLSVGVMLVVATLILVVHSLAFNFVTDDAFISFVYSKNLVQHGQLVFNLGERVEGYTNFLWTLILALGLALGIPAEIASRVLGTLCGGLTLCITPYVLRRLRGASAEPLNGVDALPSLILALVPGYACWSSGGLETQMFTLFTTLGVCGYFFEHRLAAVFLGLAALTRPEGYLFFGLCSIHQFVRGWKTRQFPLLPTRQEVRFVLLFLVLTVPHIVFRRLYYGYFAPNTYYIKTSAAGAAWAQGGYYLWAFVRESKVALLLLPSLVLLFSNRPKEGGDRSFGALGLLIVAVFAIYVASVGGDFMGLHRFVMPVVPLLVLAGVLGLVRIATWVPLPRALRVGLGGLGLGLFGVNAYVVDRHALTFLGADRGIDTPGYLRHYTADRAAIGKWLSLHVAPDDYQVVGGAGAQVYYAGIRALDSFGLSDEYIAHKVPALSSRPGHQKFAPVEYILSRNPTIITYNVYRIAGEPYRPSPAEAEIWRQRGFHFVSVQIPHLSLPWYSFLKRLDRRLGPLPKADEMSP